MTSHKHSFLDLVKICGTPSDDDMAGETLVPFYLDRSSKCPPIGRLRPQVVELLLLEHERGTESSWVFTKDDDGLIISVSFHARLSTPTLRTAVMTELCERWRDTGVLDSYIGPNNWCNELFLVYHNPYGIHGTNIAFEMERATCRIFGLPTYSIHMIVYNQETKGIWVATRAKTQRCVYHQP